MMSWKPCMSSIFDAIAMPNAVNESPMSTINTAAIKKPETLVTFRPMNRDRTSMMKPWINAVVAPPRV